MKPNEQRIAIAEGTRVGRLTALTRTRQNKGRMWLWLCRCDCGQEKEVRGADLIRGHTVSCGCYRRDVTTVNKSIHGNARRKQHSREYRIWRGIISRCTSVTNPAYEDYGARGIFVCNAWRESFSAFLSDMGNCPDGFSIDRIVNDDGYHKDNCRWATARQQANNRRKRRWKKKP